MRAQGSCFALRKPVLRLPPQVGLRVTNGKVQGRKGMQALWIWALVVSFRYFAGVNYVQGQLEDRTLRYRDNQVLP